MTTSRRTQKRFISLSILVTLGVFMPLWSYWLQETEDETTKLRSEIMLLRKQLAEDKNVHKELQEKSELYFEPRGGTITSGPSSRHHDSHENQQHHDQEEEKEVNMLLRKFKGERLFQIKKRKSTSNTGSKKSAPWLDSQLEDHSKWAVIAADIHMSLDSVLQSILVFTQR